LDEREAFQSQLRMKDAEVLDAKRDLSEMAKAQANAERTLGAIHRSKGWKMLNAYYRMRDGVRSFLPGSRLAAG
jgi:hypothetical protein